MLINITTGEIDKTFHGNKYKNRWIYKNNIVMNIWALAIIKIEDTFFSKQITNME